MRRVVLIGVWIALCLATAATARAGIVLEFHLHERPAALAKPIATLRAALETGGDLVAQPAAVRALLGAAVVPAPAITDRGLSPANLLAQINVGYKAYLDGRIDQAIPQLTAAIELGHANPALLVAASKYRTAMLDAMVSLAASYHRRNQGDDRKRSVAVMHELIRSFPDKLTSLRDAYGPEPDGIYKGALKALQAQGTGSLVVDVDAPDALIFVDESEHPQNATFKANLPPGSYRVLIKNPKGLGRRYDVEVRANETARLSVTWALATALTATDVWVGFTGMPEAVAVHHASALARPRGHDRVVLVSGAQVGGALALRATVYRASDGTVERAHQILLDADVDARVAALANVVRLGGPAPATVTNLGPRTASMDATAPGTARGTQRSTRSRRPWLVAAGIAAGTGLVASGVALQFGLYARASSNELAEVCATACTSERALALETERDDAQRMAVIAGVVGGVALVGGVVLWLVAPSASAASSETGEGVAVEFSARHGAVTYSWSY